MEQITGHIDDQRYERMCVEAERIGVSVDELASLLLSEGVDARYRMHSTGGSVALFQGLKSTNRGTES